MVILRVKTSYGNHPTEILLNELQPIKRQLPRRRAEDCKISFEQNHMTQMTVGINFLNTIIPKFVQKLHY